MPRKSFAIKAILCDPETKICRLLFRPSKKISESFSRLTRKTTRLRLLSLGCLFLILLNFNSLSQQRPTEYQVKAAFIFNFAKFVDWPPQAFAQTNSPIVVGVLGRNVFGDNLEKVIRDKTINNRPFKFIQITSPAEGRHCHILFVSPSEKDNVRKIVEDLHNASVLTVGETDHFTDAGGMINFVFEGQNIRFEINNTAAKKAGLQISSKLLSLAVRNQ